MINKLIKLNSWIKKNVAYLFISASPEIESSLDVKNIPVSDNNFDTNVTDVKDSSHHTQNTIDESVLFNLEKKFSYVNNSLNRDFNSSANNRRQNPNGQNFSSKSNKIGRVKAKVPNVKITDVSKQQVVSITYEEIGLFPRSFNRVFDRFFKQIFFDVENLVIQEYRFYRYLFLTTVKCVFILIFVPFVVNFLAKNYLVRPITEYYWNSSQPEIFLNSYQQKRAFTELQEFEEKIYFESFLFPDNNLFTSSETIVSERRLSNVFEEKNRVVTDIKKPVEIKNRNIKVTTLASDQMNNVNTQVLSSDGFENHNKDFSEIVVSEQIHDNSIQKRLQVKTLELAKHYNSESIEAITNFFADLISFSTLCYLLFKLEIQINITKSFLLEVFFGLDDSKKSLLILFITDLLVGYHSPNIWELLFSSFFDHYGLPENQTTIFLLVATLPVLLDVLFKYLIFRHLNRASPATVATYHAMIE